MSVLFISHDLGWSGEIADHVVVMRHGVVREQGPVARIFAGAAGRLHPGAAGLPADPRATRSAPPAGDRRPHRRPQRRRPGDGQAEGPQRAGVAARCGRWPRASCCASGLFGKREFEAVRGRQLSAPRRGHTLGVVGESGSGKTTMGLTLLRLHEPTGRRGRCSTAATCSTLSDSGAPAMRRRIQIVFQNPYASLNPRFTIGQTLIEPMTIHGIGADAGRARAARARAAGARSASTTAALRQIPARVLRRPAPAHRDRALPRRWSPRCWCSTRR